MLKKLSSLIEQLAHPRGHDSLGEDDLRIAAAALLVHTLAIDGEITEAESKQLHSLLAEHFDLSPDEVDGLISEAERRERDAVDIYKFTSVLRDTLPIERKRDIIAMMWRLVFADGKLDPIEDNLIWRTAELLAVPARDRMQLKQMVRAETGAR
jgi:uncharacterized tellurite resistance protein B-like protein